MKKKIPLLRVIVRRSSHCLPNALLVSGTEQMNRGRLSSGGEGQCVGNNDRYTSPSCLFSDLWEFNFNRSEWSFGWFARLAGGSASETLPPSSTFPGGREGMTCWNIPNRTSQFLFGGTGSVRYTLNDLYRFDLEEETWKLEAGNSFALVTYVAAQTGAWLPKGTAPPSRRYALSWTSVRDGTVRCFLFGGHSGDFNDDTQFLNDLWELNSETTRFKFLGGSIGKYNSAGSYVKKGYYRWNRLELSIEMERSFGLCDLAIE